MDDEIRRIKDFYENVYYKDVKSVNNRSISRHYLRLYKRLKLTSTDSVLDVACGTGHWLEICKDAGSTIGGVDLSERAIEACRARLPDGDFHAVSADNLPFEDQQFSVVTCLGSLEHFVDPVKCIKEMIRVSTSNAKFVLLVPNSGFLTRRLGLFKGTAQVEAKETVRSLDEWQQIFNQAGLSVQSRWRDLHVLNGDWIKSGPMYMWPLRAIQALMLAVWPLQWQYQVYHLCRVIDR